MESFGGSGAVVLGLKPKKSRLDIYIDLNNDFFNVSCCIKERPLAFEYDPTLLDGPPQAVPIETIIETKFNLTLEYHCLRKNGSIRGETIFDVAIWYDQIEKRHRLIAVKPGTILDMVSQPTSLFVV